MTTNKSNLSTAKDKVAQALGAKEKAVSETDVLDTLKEEHEEVKDLLSDLQDATQAAERRQLVAKIKAALIPHTKAEEKVVYDAIISTAEERSETDGHEGYLEHRLASETLKHLEGVEPTSPEHKAAGKVLKELVEHHIKEEEGSVWKDVKEHFDKESRCRMNVDFEAAKKAVKPS